MVFIGYKPTTDWEYYGDLVGGDWNIFMTFHSVGNGIIIPTDVLSIIFQRGRFNKPPTRIIYGQFTNLYGILGEVWDHEWNKNTKSMDLLRIHI